LSGELMVAKESYVQRSATDYPYFLLSVPLARSG
jgi:hypothetical protein